MFVRVACLLAFLAVSPLPALAADEPCPCDCAATEHLEAWLLDARIQLAKLLVTRGEKHPEVLAARAEIASLEGSSARFDAWGGDKVALRLADACRQDAVLALTLGPAHPERRALTVTIEVLAATIREAQGTAASCSAAAE